MLALERRLFTDPGLQRVIANSSQVQQEIIRHYQVDPERIAVIYNGLDRERFHPLEEPERTALRSRLGAPAGAPLILFAGSGFGRKGLTFLIDACGSLKNKAAVLWVVGKGRAAPYEEQARRRGLAGRLKFWGAQDDLAPFYQAATVLALPTIYDPCSNVVLEALGCGLPVLTTSANGAAEFITPGENGEILARPDDADRPDPGPGGISGQGRGPGGAPGRGRGGGATELGGHRGPDPGGVGGSWVKNSSRFKVQS